MKAATGELNLTVITIIAIAAIMGLFTVFLYPRIKDTITQQWANVSNTDTSTDAWDKSGQTSGQTSVTPSNP